MTKRNLLKQIREDFRPVSLPIKEDRIPNRSHIRSLNDTKIIPITDIIPDPNQPRKTFKEESLQELAQSIKTKGILDPLTIRFAQEKAKYLIVTGERRYRAAVIAGLAEIPCLIRDLTDQEALIFQLIENVQREDLSPIEEAMCYKKLMDDYKWTQTRVSEETGKSQPYISQTQKLLTLPKSILEEAKTARISKEHLLQLTKAEDPEALWQEVKQGKTAKEIKAEHKEKCFKGRPKNFRYAFAPVQKPYKVLVQFNRPNVEEDEIEEALHEALANVGKPFSKTQFEARR